MKRKVISTLLLSAFILGSATVVVKADSGTKVDFSYDIDETGRGMVSGKGNNKFYHLTPGKVHVNVSGTSSYGTMTMILQSDGVLWDSQYGSHIVNGTGNYVYDVDADKTNYYLKAYGGSRNTTQYVYGVMHDHRP